jgi:lipopolysaccharide export LptBFGC system permease protein LptF
MVRLPAVSTLSRYVATRFLRAFAGSLLILAMAVLVIDMLLNLEDVLEFESSLLGALRFLWLRLASVYLPYLLPVATFTAAFFSVGVLARSREIIAMKAGGISPLVALIPVFIASAFVAILALLANETLTVGASAALAKSTGAASGGVELRAGTIWYHTGRYVYNIASADAGSDSVRDIRVFERNEGGRLVRLIQASRARRIAPHEWRFEDATVRSFDPSQPTAAPRVERAREITLRLEEERSPLLLQAEIASLPVWTLARYVQAAPGDARARSLLHQRLSSPLLVLLFALLAVPLALRVERTRSLALPALEGVVILFFFLLAREYGAGFAALDPTAATLAPWAILFAFAGLGAFQLSRVET